jgi:hypothetical protein
LNSEKKAEKTAVEYSETQKGYYFKGNTFFYCDATVLVGQDLLIIEDS